MQKREIAARYEKVDTNCYASLGKYNTQSPGITPPIPENITSYVGVVPLWNYKLDYNTLVKNGACDRYTKIVDAYGSNDGKEEPKYIEQPCM